MFVSKSYRNNMGYQTQTSRPKPIDQWTLTRYNKNIYSVRVNEEEEHEVRVSHRMGSTHGLQYGGGQNNIQSGSGIDPETIMTAMTLLKAGASVAKAAYVSDKGTKLKNSFGRFINNDDSNWKPGFAGEMHLINPLTGVQSNWTGPGTNVEARLKRGDVGVSELDELSKIHDIDYYKARNWGDVRSADKKYINNIKNSNIGYAQKKIMTGLMKAKTTGEDIGLFGKEQFTSFPNIQNKPNFVGKGDNIFPSKGDPIRKLKNRVKKKYKKKNTDKLLVDALKFIKKKK